MLKLTQVHFSLISATCVAATSAVCLSLFPANDRTMILASAGIVQVCSLLLCAAYADIRSHRISNQITYPSIVAALILLVLGAGDSELQGALLSPWDALLGASVCGLLLGSFWMMRAIGGGDVKLMIAVGLLTGCQTALTALLAAHLLAAAGVVSWTAFKRLAPVPAVELANVMPADMLDSSSQPKPTLRSNKRIPMGGFYAAGVIAALLFKALSV